MQTITEKLASIEEKRRRWQTRLKRAVTALDKLERQRKRLNGLAPKAKEVTADLVEVRRQVDTAIEAAAPEDKPIPDFLDRSDPLIAERMTAARKKAEEAERHKMPLSGRDALKAIRAERRRKKD